MKQYEPECYQIVENIRQIKAQKGVSQSDLAADAGLSSSHLHYILSGRNLPALNSLVRIARALNVSLQEIIGDVSKDWETKSVNWRLEELTKQQIEIITNLINYFLNEKNT